MVLLVPIWGWSCKEIVGIVHSHVLVFHVEGLIKLVGSLTLSGAKLLVLWPNLVKQLLKSDGLFNLSAVLSQVLHIRKELLERIRDYRSIFQYVSLVSTFNTVCKVG